MSMKVTFVAHRTYLYAVTTGVLNVGEAKKQFARILAACRRRRLSRVLIDLRPLVFPGPLTTFARFDFATFAADQVIHMPASGTARVRVAVVSPAQLIDRTGFGETVALNRGADVHTTSDLADALAWLGVDPSDAP